jgi:hypothetical protein
VVSGLALATGILLLGVRNGRRHARLRPLGAVPEAG